MNLMNFLEVTGTNKLKEKTNGEGIKIAVLDTGCNIDNEKIVYRYDFFDESNSARDNANHGTSIVNIIQTIAPKSEIYIIKILDDIGLGNMANISTGLSLASNLNVDIVCMSLGGWKKFSKTTIKGLQLLYKRGIMILSAVGNNNSNDIYYPSKYNEVLSVGGLSTDLNIRWKNSNYCRETDVVALAEDVETIDNELNKTIVNGTSFANAIVVGQIALMKSVDTGLTDADILKYCSDSRRLETAKGFLNINEFLEELNI